MPTGEERRLRLIKSTSPGPVSVGRPVGRRTVVRRVPRAKDPVEAILKRLDEEPVELDGPDETGASAGPDEDGGTDRRATEDADAGTDANAARPKDASTDTDADTTENADTTDNVNPDPDTDAADRADRADGVADRAGRRPVLTALLATLLCAALAAAGFTGYQWYQDRALDRAHERALAAARQTTVNFVSVSASSVDRDLARITAGATGEFREEFIRGQAQVRAAVMENQVESHGTVLRAGLLSGDLRHAVVLVAVDATVKNVHAPEGRLSHYRIQVDLTRERDSDTWLVSRLQFVG